MSNFITYSAWTGSTYIAQVKKRFKNGTVRVEIWARLEEDGKWNGPLVGGTIYLKAGQYAECV
jgi:hypothetical protein